MPKVKKFAQVLLSVVGTFGVLALVFRKADLTVVGAYLTAVDLRWALLAALLGPLQFGLAGMRWRLISRALGADIPVREAISECGLSSLLNQVLPGGIAGDAVRVWRRRGHQPLPGALRAAVLDRWAGLWAHVLVTLVGLLIGFAMGYRWSMELGLVAALLVILSTVAWWGQLGGDARIVAKGAGATTVWLSLAMTALFLLGFLLSGLAVGQPVGPWVVVGVPLVLLSMAVPISVGGWGLREATAIVLLPRLGWSVEAALAVSAVYGLTSLVGALPGGITLLFSDRTR